MEPLTPGFIAAHSHRLEDLTDITVNLLARYPLEPLAEEALLVQSNGIAQWLKIQLATHTGVATMLDVTLPARFVWRAYRAVLGEDIPRHSPYDKQRLRWRIMRLLPALMASHAAFTALQRYVADDSDQRKLFQLSDKLADLYDQYQVYRAEWLDAWAQGDDVIFLRGQAQPLTDEHAWQPELWRALVDDIGREQICSNRAALHRTFIERASALSNLPAGISPRVVVFGISSLPKQTLEVLHALKGVCQVVLCVHNPCQYHWADIVDGRELFRHNQTARHALKSADFAEVAIDALHLHAQPLLASWGKQGRDYIRLLDEFDETRQMEAKFADLRFDLFDDVEAVNLLQQLQNDILHLRPVHETHAAWGMQVAEQDRSICFHRCHSAQREVEVLHDQLLAAFAADPDLQPKDIMVMVPDIDQYAPHIAAVFGRLHRDDQRYIPFTIADQGQRHKNPILIALELVLAAPQQRFTHSDVFDLLQVPAVQQRFKLQPADVEQLQQWAAQAGARWGLQEQHRMSLGLDVAYAENSWLFALQRMLYGYAAGEVDNQPWQGIEPYTEVAGMQAQTAGALADIINCLQFYWRALANAKSFSAWYPILQQLLDDLFSPREDSEQLMLNRLREALDELAESIDEAQFDGDLRYNIVQEVWLSAVDESGLNQRFMAGSVNFATLMPMRAIPFKRVCLLGMNDADYPRSTPATDFDLMAGHYQPGDRSRREDDRYLFLEALLSAREQFYLSWVGMSAQDNSEMPPSVLVGQLRDHLAAGWQAEPAADDEDLLLDRLTTSHRLQPFAADYFSAPEGSHTQFFTYAREWLPIHRNGHQNISSPLQDAAQLEPFEPEAPLQLYDLEWLLREPAQLFARKRLGVSLQDLSSESYDDEAFNLNKLDEWKVKHELVTQVLLHKPAHHSACAEIIDDTFARIRRRGQLPLSYEVHHLKTRLADSVATISDTIRPYWAGDYLNIADTSFNLPLGRFAIEGELTDLYRHRQQDTQLTQVLVKVSKVAHITSRSQYVLPKHCVSLWLRHLIAQLVFAGSHQVETLLVGEGASVRLAALSADDARGYLDELGRLMDHALSQPLATALPLAWAWLDKPKSFDLTQAYSKQAESLVYLSRFYPQAEALTMADFEGVSERHYQSFKAMMDKAQLTSYGSGQGGAK
ncbi:MAG: exodeoxyribonuclease V subunit gamma [Idiomarina sp.]|nr:exodeoxyribonuclease V subunit gamma [Idiomarina sp.]